MADGIEGRRVGMVGEILAATDGVGGTWGRWAGVLPTRREGKRWADEACPPDEPCWNACFWHRNPASRNAFDGVVLGHRVGYCYIQCRLRNIFRLWLM